MAVFCTTDDPADPHASHQKIRADGLLTTRVYPTFRPDKALAVNQPEVFNAWLDKLAAVSGVACGGLPDFLAALRRRHDFFHKMGGRLSDHGPGACDAEDCTEAEAQRAFDEARAGRQVNPADAAKFRGYLMLFFGHLDAEKGWTKQLHLGVIPSGNWLRIRGENEHRRDNMPQFQAVIRRI